MSTIVAPDGRLLAESGEQAATSIVILDAQLALARTAVALLEDRKTWYLQN